VRRKQNNQQGTFTAIANASFFRPFAIFPFVDGGISVINELILGSILVKIHEDFSFLSFLIKLIHFANTLILFTQLFTFLFALLLSTSHFFMSSSCSPDPDKQNERKAAKELCCFSALWHQFIS
jgi:hypothetical protein